MSRAKDEFLETFAPLPMRRWRRIGGWAQTRATPGPLAMNTRRNAETIGIVRASSAGHRPRPAGVAPGPILPALRRTAGRLPAFLPHLSRLVGVGASVRRLAGALSRRDSA